MLYSSVKVTKFALVLAALGLGLGSLGAASASSSTGNGGTPVGSRTVVGCTGGGGAPVTHGPRSRPVVALTFDEARAHIDAGDPVDPKPAPRERDLLRGGPPRPRHAKR